VSVLGKHALLEAMNEPKLSDRLVVTPIFVDDQVGPGSIDIRLGHEFITTRRGNLKAIDPGEMKEEQRRRYEHRNYVELQQTFVLHPNELVLAATMEWFRLPAHLAGYVTSRSSWGRAGLIVATAVAVHPGFAGCITLELVNTGEVPFVLYPGLRVAQFVAFSCEQGDAYTGAFATQPGPSTSHSKMLEERDRQFWTRKTEQKA
jgi:dCTP deaminase